MQIFQESLQEVTVCSVRFLQDLHFLPESCKICFFFLATLQNCYKILARSVYFLNQDNYKPLSEMQL